MRFLHLAATLLVFCACSGRAPAPEHPNAARASIEALSFLAGAWRTEGNADSFTIELWSPPSDGVMRGASISREGAARGAAELSWIVSREGTLVFVAAPSGQAMTEFTLTHLEGSLARFEDPAHDFPKWLEYERVGDTLVARIGGTAEQRTATWTYARTSDTPPARAVAVRVCPGSADGELEVVVPPCTCGAEVLCADLPEAVPSDPLALGLVVLDSACDACLEARGTCRAPRARAQLGDACVEVTVTALAGVQ